MPIINNSDTPYEEAEGRRARRFVNKDAGAANLTVGELVMDGGSALRLHTHPTDEAIVAFRGQRGDGGGRRVAHCDAGPHPACPAKHTPQAGEPHRRRSPYVHHLPDGQPHHRIRGLANEGSHRIVRPKVGKSSSPRPTAILACPPCGGMRYLSTHSLGLSRAFHSLRFQGGANGDGPTWLGGHRPRDAQQADIN